MINRDGIEAGDKCFTRDGGCLVARDAGGGIALATKPLTFWNTNGTWHFYGAHPLDLIRIEKAPKPVTLIRWLGFNSGDAAMCGIEEHAMEWPNVMKLTYVDGKLEKAEQVK